MNPLFPGLTDLSWAKSLLAIAYSEEDAIAAYQHWETIMSAIPGAAVRVSTIKDPLGGAMYFLFTNQPGVSQVSPRTPEDVRTLISPEEDEGALHLMRDVLRSEEL